MATTTLLTGEDNAIAASRPAIRYRHLGAVRFVLAAMVFLWHALPALGVHSAIGETKFGPVAVFVFFVISGFIIGEGAFTFYRHRPLAFIGNRVLRLWPPYIFAILVMVVLLAIAPDPSLSVGSPAAIGANMFALFPTVPLTDWLFGIAERNELLGIVWALRVEFAFYFAVAAGLYLAEMMPALARHPALLPSILWALLALHVVVYHLWSPTTKLTFYLTFAPYFILGIAVAAADHRKLAPRSALFIGAVALILSLFHTLTHQPAQPRALAWTAPVTGGSIAAATLWLALTLMAALSLRLDPHPLPKPVDRQLGDLTYAVYLLHVPAIMLIRDFTSSRGAVGIFLAFVLVVLLAFVSNMAIEGTLRPLRQRLRGASLPS